MKPDIIPIVIGVSLCSASALLLYIWYKTKDTDDVTDAPSSSTSASKSKTTKLECTIPNSIVPIVVGRSGANISAIERKSNTQIRFKAKDDNNQICEITGKIEDVHKAAELIKLAAKPQPNITEEMFVPQSTCGKVFDFRGEALQEICRKSQAKVHVESGDRNDGETRRVLITGTRAHVNLAKSLIEEKIRLDEESRKNLDVKREPRGNVRKPINEAATSTPAEAVVPKREKLPISSTEGQLEVYVSAVASPSRFWIQLYGKQSAELDTLIESMTKYYDKPDSQRLHKIADPYLGQIVAAIFKYDSKWYRAEIVGILPNDYNPRDVVLDLYFVDFGDSEYVQPTDVFELRTDFLTLRFQAIECFLANVKPKFKEEDDNWETHAISRFEDLTNVAKWKKMNARIVTTKERKCGDPVKREGSPIPGVQLFNMDTPDVNIADELIAEGFADAIISNGSHRNENVVHVTGGNENNGQNKIATGKNHSIGGNDEFAATDKSMTNGSDVNPMNAKKSTKSFIDSEKLNGNKEVITDSDTDPVDSNSTRPIKVT